MRWKLVLLVVVGAGALGALGFRRRAAQQPASARIAFARVDRGQVIEGVHATGTVQPRVLVSVGTQVTGVIDQIYKDFNDPVRAGEVIAVVDSRRLVSQVLQDEAALGKAQADLERTQALLEQAENDYGRATTLASKKLVANSDLDAARANARSLRAQVSIAAAVISLSVAQLEGDRVNLKLATIVSPIDGVVVARNVDLGQTMAAALQAPTLFQIANDLKKVQVQVSVPEADVGRVKLKQRATFKVDAYQDRAFVGCVSQIRLAATTISNVVTYTVLVDAENLDEILLPGMTANVTFEVREERDALRVPVSALRFEPSRELALGSSDSPDEPRVFVKASNGRLTQVSVVAGASDGIRVAITPGVSGSLAAGAEVATGLVQEDDENAPTLDLRPPGADRKKPGGP